MTFFNDFMTQLIKTENLVDVSTTCKTSQSSFSKWSKEEDVNNILSDTDSEFANLTSSELNPWIKIDFEKQLSPEYIIIHNSDKKPFNKVASQLKVEYSIDDREYFTLHQGQLHFGYLPKSMPLILPLKNNILFRFLKLSLTSFVKIPLQLKQVNVLIPNKSNLINEGQKVTFYSSRTDGLGERLKSLLNAMVLAKFYGMPFKFTWNNLAHLGEHHSVDNPEKMFSYDFLTNNLVENIPDNRYELDKSINTPLIEPINSEAIRVSQQSIFKQLPALKSYISPSSFAQAFEKIGFHSKIEEAIHIANQLELPRDTMAIHLRAGDIIYGKHRFGDRYTNKVISYPQADFIISELKKVNIEVILFGQNQKVCRYLANKFGALYFGDTENNLRFDPTQLAIFDMVLMSRTTQIFSGNSGFAQLSELIGDTQITSPHDYFDIQAMAAHIEDLLQSEETNYFDDYQNAFSCWHYIHSFKSIEKIETSITLLVKAHQYDSENIFYLLILSIFYFRNNDIKNSESTIQTILNYKKNCKGKFGGYTSLMRFKYHDQKGRLHNYKGFFIRMSKSGVKGSDVLVKDFS